MKKKNIGKQGLMALGLATALSLSGTGAAAEMPGKGVTVQPLKSSIAEETFQTLIVMKALEELGYKVRDIKEIGRAHV